MATRVRLNTENTNEDGDDSDADEGLLPSFEKKYKQQMRQIVTQKLDLPISTLPSMLQEQIKIDPEFQRRDRWDEARQSRLIESLLMNVPIPPVFLGEDEYGHYVVLDGRQRLTAIRNFLNNTLKLRKLNVWDDLNGKTFDDLVKRGLDKHLTRRFVPAVAILKESSAAVKYDVFERLNTGGVKANDMEIRNAVFRGGFTNLLHKVTRLPEFCDAWGIPKDKITAESNSMYSEMGDISIALRFFALSDPQEIEGPFRDWLSDFMQTRNSDYSEEDRIADYARFKTAYQNVLKVFGGDAFRNPTKDKKAGKSVPLADAVTIGLSHIDSAIITQEVASAMRERFPTLLANANFSKSVSSGTNGKGAIINRVGMASEFFQSIAEEFDW